ncbi:hypothetical protein M408DRAFT_325830 [Serendipita vermifera MAFF 305830]|uniref:Uncharacterized protein n=1 Tax=Serendipita vermifera MAFF 305830 TaxID=933852 RepID=A0A0C3BSQ5_SERVB|nr:hypothetical protein M408DRAFT_325830 [Serendipita vermifera MAFF 305830]
MQAIRIITALFFAAVAIAAPVPVPGFPVPATTTEATATGGDASVDGLCGSFGCSDWKQ